MSDFALWPVLAGAAAFFAVGTLWYGVLFGMAAMGGVFILFR